MRAIFEKTGVHVLVDGQFGSTGKGALSAWLANQGYRYKALDHFSGVITSAGPNSGHTSYYGQEKIVLKQLPTFAVHAHMMGHTIPVYLSAGAVIDPDILAAEAKRYPKLPIYVHPNAVLISPEDKEEEMDEDSPQSKIASTRSGTGVAIARKVLRHSKSVIGAADNAGIMANMPPNIQILKHRIKPEEYAYFMELSQGFSLGIHSQFYPHVTSRECTVMQGLADARISPKFLAKTFMTVRTFPIRVGNLGNHSSGGWYDDQKEVTWEEIGQKPELTTVTQRVRRVATFSMLQYIEACQANMPDWVAINFLNYLKPEEQAILIEDIREMNDNLGWNIGLIGGYSSNVDGWKVLT